jgi:hypothetical protein
MDKFKEELEAAQATAAVPTADRVAAVKPGEDSINSDEEGCPDEKEWQMYDPLYNESSLR